MSVVFDPFTGQIIDTGSSAGMAIGGPVAGADPNAILLTDGATNLTDIQLGTGEILIGKAGDAPIASTITQTINQVYVTNGPNSITLSLPQDIANTSSPEFAGMTLTAFSGPVKATAGILSSSAINLTSGEVSGILTTDKGGTGVDGSAAPNGHILIGNGAGYTLADILGTTNQVNVTNGSGSIQLSLPQDIHSGASPEFFDLFLAGTLDTALVGGTLGIGTNNASTINIGSPTATVNIQGTTIYQNVTNLNVSDKNITVNVGGSVGSSGGSGIHVEEGGVSNAGHVEVTGDRLGWELHPPGVVGIAYIYPGVSGITIDQSSHDPVTIASPANGLGIINQEISIELATASSTGALSSTDWSTFNNKQDKVIYKVTAHDPINTTLPTVDPVVIDGHTIVTGDSVLFSNLSVNNNKIYTATVSGGAVSWTQDATFTPNVSDYVIVETGTAFSTQLGVFNGTLFNFNTIIRHFNGADYWEQTAIYTVPLANNTANNVFTINIANSENMIIDYSIVRGSSKTTGTLHITANSSTSEVSVSDTGVDLNSPLGTSFSASITSGQITLVCTTDNLGSSGELKYNLRRWSDISGGPAGPPSYSGGGGSGSLTVEQLNGAGAGSYPNINTIKFNNDTGFLVTDLGGGEVEINLGSTFKTWNIDNGAGPAQPSLVAVGEDTVEFIAGSGIEFTTDNTLGAKTFTITATGGGASVQTATINNNQTSPLLFTSYDKTTKFGAKIEFALERTDSSGNKRRETGRILVVSDGASGVNIFTDSITVGGSPGVTFSALVNGSTIEINYATNDFTPNGTGTLKYTIQTW